MPLPAEIAANVFNTLSILLAGRNNVHTWWTGIAGCLLFGWVFAATQLYADATLQVFFVATSSVGWWRWRSGRRGRVLPVRRSPLGLLVPLGLSGLAVTAGYAWLLHRFTDAFAPVPDSVVLAFSVLGQFLLMARRLETWWCWLLVDSVAVPLYAARGLYLTALLYTVFWINAAVSLRHWGRLAAAAAAAAAAAEETP